MDHIPKQFANFSDGSPVPLDGKFHVDPSNPMVSVKYLESWYPPGVLRVFAGDDRFTRKALDIEHSILLELGGHERLVKYLGRDEHGLRFKYAVNGDLRHYMSKQEPGSISLGLRRKWLRQAAQIVAFIHSKGVVHCDIHPNNFLLDGHLDLLLCDFSGSWFGELDGAAMESTRYFLPRDPLSTPDVRSDLFALGSAMYHIMSGHDPYDTLPESEVTARYSQVLFPDVDEISCGHVINGCWTGALGNAHEVVQDLEKCLHEVPAQIDQKELISDPHGISGDYQT